MARASHPAYVPLEADVPAEDAPAAVATGNGIELKRDSVRYTTAPGANTLYQDAYLQPQLSASEDPAGQQQVKDDGEGYEGVRKPSYVTTMENDVYEAEVPDEPAPNRPTSDHYLSPVAALSHASRTAQSHAGVVPAAMDDGYMPPAQLTDSRHVSANLDDATVNYTNL